MKTNFYLLLVLATLSVHSQVNFENGYYITTENEKIDCLIKNYDWISNPTKVEFKAAENTEAKELSINFIKGFGIYNVSKFIQETVAIDRSNDDLNHLNDQREPINKIETLLLKVIIEGKASLYSYTDGNFNRFFYKINNSPIQQLVHKLYQNNGVLGENNRYKQQLWNELKCAETTLNQIERLRYEKDKLSAYFIKYNTCNNSESVTFEKEKEKKDMFNLTLRTGMNNSFLSVQGLDKSDARGVDFGNKLNIRIGLEAELILGFNKNKWSIFIEPTYNQSYKSDKSSSNPGVSSPFLRDEYAQINYQAIDIPIGIRHYFFLNNDSKIFINGALVLNFNKEAEIEYKNYSNLKINTKSNLALGIGYKFKDKYSVELRHQTKRELLRDYITLTGNYQTSSLIFGYTIF